MKYFIGIMILILMGLVSCHDDDGIGAPMEEYDLLSFVFPQGNNSWDREIEQIAKDWGMYIIYKDIDSVHLNRMWTSPLYNEPIYTGTNIAERDIPVYLDLVKNWLLGSLDLENERDRQMLPMYFYFLNDLHDGNPRSAGSKAHIQFKQDGFDYWCLSFTSEEMEEGLSVTKRHKVACSFVYPSIKNRVASGEYEVAPDFMAVSDYETPIGCNYNPFSSMLDEMDPVNVFWRRGFAANVSEEFSISGSSFYQCPCWIPWIPIMSYTIPGMGLIEVTRNPNSNAVKNTVEERAKEDFLNMIRLAMYLSKERLNELYPLEPVDGEDESNIPMEPEDIAGYEKIHQKYDIVVDWMLDEYGVDLLKYSSMLDEDVAGNE